MSRTRVFMGLLTAAALLLTACGGAATKPAETKPAETKPAETKPAATQPAASGPVKLTKPVNLRIATGPQGGGWYAYGASMAELLRKELPAGSTIDVLPKALGIGNAKLLQSGEAELGLLFPPVAKWAAAGNVAFDKKQDKVMGLIGGMDDYYGAIMISGKLGINSLKEVADKKMGIKLVTQNIGSQSEWFTRQVLEHYKLNYDMIKSWGGSMTATDYGNMANLAKDGKADVYITVLTPKHPTFTEIAQTTDYKFVPLPDDLIDHLVKNYGFNAGVMPKDTFPKQTSDVKLVQFPTTLAANADLPEDVAYVVTKTIVENFDTLKKAYKAMEVFKAENAWKPEVNGVGQTLHPGAVKYYKEKGWMK